MLIDLRTVAPGDLPLDAFEELIAGNGYGPEMTQALRDHLVHGLVITEAAKRRAVHRHKLKMRVDALLLDIARIGRINAALNPQLDHLAHIARLSRELVITVDSLCSGRTLPASKPTTNSPG